MSFAIEAKSLSKSYGGTLALRNLSFAIPEGEVAAFLGPNSAGKTTTLKILAGLIRGSEGSASISGYSVVYQASQVKRLVGYMPELNPLPDEPTIEEFLCYRARLKELHGKLVKSRVRKVAADCDLTGKILRRPIGVLSRGVRQRVGIADALLTDPPVLLLDEPTIGLDPHQVLTLRDLISSMRGSHTVFLSTHILSEAEAIADRVLIINKGEKVAFGTPEELRSQYKSASQFYVTLNIERKQLQSLIEPLGGNVVEKTPRGEGDYRYLLECEAGAKKLLSLLTHTQGVELSEFANRSPSLESIFIEATQEGGSL